MRKLFLILLVGSNLLAQPQFIASLYPTQHALNVPADAVLHVGLRTSLDPASLSDSSIYVWSDITGLHKLTVTLENGNKDLHIVPRHWRLNDRPPFNAGERVTVTLTTRLRYADGKPFEGFTWHYTVAVKPFTSENFKPLVTFGGGLSSYFYVSDFNSDGWPDLVGNDDGSAQRKMFVYFNDGKGILRLSHLENIFSPSGGETVDIDHDGDQEMTYGADQYILNDGTGHFTVKVFPERAPGFFKAYDFNNDGLMDFAIGTVVNDTVFFSLSEKGKISAKKFYKRSPLRPEFYYPGLSYDLNNDGRVDLILGGIREPAPLGFVSFQNITQDSASISQYLETQFERFGAFGNDFDGDSYIDYIMVGGGSGKNIQYRNNGKGILMPQGLKRDSTIVNGLFETITGGDWDGDGDIDLAFANTNQSGPYRTAPDVWIYANNGKGNFTFLKRIPLPFQTFINYKLEAADLDRDGDLDIIGIATGIFYVLANGSFATTVSSDKSDQLPIQFSLSPSHPNPFAQETRVQILLPDKESKTIMATIFSLTGQTIRSWQIDNKDNMLEIVWDGRDQQSQLVPNGLYFLNVRVGNNSSSQKLMLLR